MDVLNVSWGSIPQKDHNHMLFVLPSGSYIKSLPVSYNIQENPIVRIPVLGRIKEPSEYDPSDVSVCETVILKFRKIKVVSRIGERTFIWQKE